MDKDLLSDIRTRFKETWHRIDNQFNRYAKSLGANFTAILVLELIYDSKESYTQKDLCEKLVLPKQLINSLITSFLERGYVELREAKDDRRNKEITLTDNGKKYAENILGTIQDAENKAWECFTDEEAIAFSNAMEKYGKSLENILKTRKDN